MYLLRENKKHFQLLGILVTQQSQYHRKRLRVKKFEKLQISRCNFVHSHRYKLKDLLNRIKGVEGFQGVDT